MQRLKMLARRAGETPTPTPAAEGDSSINLPELSGTVADAMANPAKPAGARRGDAPLTQRVLDALTNVLPIRRISDDEFVATMEKRNGEIEKRLAEIEREQAALFERAAAKEGETK